MRAAEHGVRLHSIFKFESFIRPFAGRASHSPARSATHVSVTGHAHGSSARLTPATWLHRESRHPHSRS